MSRPDAESMVYTGVEGDASYHTTGSGGLFFTATGTMRVSPRLAYTVSSSSVRSSVLESATSACPGTLFTVATTMAIPRPRAVLLLLMVSTRRTVVSELCQWISLGEGDRKSTRLNSSHDQISY